MNWRPATATIADFLPPEWTQSEPSAFDETALEMIQPVVCDLNGYLEAAYRGVGAEALAHFQAMKRAAAGCYDPGDVGLSVVAPSLPFPGGQCNFDYRVIGTVRRHTDNRSETINTFIRGPLLGPREIFIGGGENDHVIVFVSLDPNGQESLTSFGNLPAPRGQSSVEALSVYPAGGQSDSCGSLPLPPPDYPVGPDLPFPPSPGDVVIPIQFKDLNVNVGGVNIPVSIPFGPFTFNNDGTIGFDIGPKTFRYGPDGVEEPDPEAPGPGEDGAVGQGLDAVARAIAEKECCEYPQLVEAVRYLADKHKESVDALAEVIAESLGEIGARLSVLRELVSPEVEVDVDFRNCQGDFRLERVSGTGLGGVIAQIEKTRVSLQGSILSACPVPPDGRFEWIELGGGESDGPLDMDVFLLPNGAVGVSVRVLGVPPAARIFKATQDYTEAAYGHVSLIRRVLGRQCIYPLVRIELGEVFLPVDVPGPGWSVRVSIKGGVSYTVSCLVPHEVPDNG
jgi:hypothetical protein